MKEDWEKVEKFVTKAIGKTPNDLKGYLFVLGVQILGKGARYFSKEQKQDLIHIATCEIFSLNGYYKFTHRDDDGWPHYELQDSIPHAKLFGQEALIKEQLIAYFKKEELI